MDDLPPTKHPSVTDPGTRAVLAEGERLYPAGSRRPGGCLGRDGPLLAKGRGVVLAGDSAGSYITQARAPGLSTADVHYYREGFCAALRLTR